MGRRCIITGNLQVVLALGKGLDRGVDGFYNFLDGFDKGNAYGRRGVLGRVALLLNSFILSH